MKRDFVALVLLIVCVVTLTLIGVAGCGGDSTSYCDHGNRIYRDHGVAANDPSCPR